MESFSLSEILHNLKEEIHDFFPDPVWIHAEISECRENQSGHCYAELIEKDSRDRITAKIRANIWAMVYGALKPYFESVTGQPLQAGMKVLVQATFEFHEVYGLSLSITDIDPSYTLGDIALKRDKIIRQLTEDGVLDMNKELQLALVPYRVAIISSPTAAGYGDFCNHLQHNRFGYKFRCTLFAAQMQGENTEKSVIAALDNIAEQVENFDVVVIIRGGGATSELSAFDNYNLAYYCTQFPLPILAGIGHQRDLSVVDYVAYKSMKTPTAVADFLIECCMNYEERLNDLRTRAVSAFKVHLDEHQRHLFMLSVRMGQAPQKIFLNCARHLNNTYMKLQMAAHKQVDMHKQSLRALQQRLSLASPDECLSRGYVRIFKNGEWVKNSPTLSKEDQVEIQFEDGTKKAVIK